MAREYIVEAAPYKPTTTSDTCSGLGLGAKSVVHELVFSKSLAKAGTAEIAKMLITTVKPISQDFRLDMG